MKVSAGILVYSDEKVFLVHPGGPFYRNKKCWFIPKGEVQKGDENDWQAAAREWQEETGDNIRSDDYIDLGFVKRSGKSNHIFAIEQDAEWKSSNTFEMQFKSGQVRNFPETDDGGWFTLDEAEQVLPKNQKGFIERIREYLSLKQNGPT